MRGFFLLLLLTNVAFMVWQYLQADTGNPVDIYQGMDAKGKGNGLVLLSELPPEKRPALRDGEEAAAEEQPKAVAPAEGEGTDVQAAEADTGAAEAIVDETVAQCMRISGITDQTGLDSLLRELKKLAATRMEEGSEQSQKTNYWVMLPPYQSRSKAAEAAALLKEKRIKDFFIVRSGDYENAVSLGVFSTRERAKRRFDEITSLKAKLRRPKIEAIELPAKRYWVRFELKDKAQQKGLEAVLKKQGLEKAEEISCK